MEEDRRRIHNGMISDVSILARMMKLQGLDSSWIKNIGNPENDAHRARFAKLAIQNTLNILSKLKQENKKGE